MRIALIHAVRVAMPPVEDAFQRHWPEAERMNLLDDSLSMDRARDAQLSVALSRRIGALADYAIECGATGILYTCSAFGDAIEAVKERLDAPVLKPNEAMCEEAQRHGKFSTARAPDAVAAAVACPVLTSPDSAVLAMRKRLH